MEEAGGAPIEQKQILPSRTQTKTYEIEGASVDVNYRSIFPKNSSPDNKQPNSERRIIFLPGWSLDANTKSAATIGQAFSDAGNSEVLIIDTKPNEIVEDSLNKEAEAIARLVKEQGIKNIIIAGYSEGGIRSVDLVSILQRQRKRGETDISVDGVILMESLGLYEQESALKLATSFVKDGLIDGQINTLNSQVSKREGIGKTEARTARVTMDVVFGVMREIVRSKGIKYPQRLRSQIEELTDVQKYLDEVKAPVILIQGAKDLVSSPEKILPGYKDKERETALRKELFPNSPYIRMVVGKRLGTHGMPLYRAEQVAKDSLYLLDRYKKGL
jgi:pimeloyl-ACP methyl ester carboxylesterase